MTTIKEIHTRTATYSPASFRLPDATAEYTASGRVLVFPLILPAIIAVAQTLLILWQRRVPPGDNSWPGNRKLYFPEDLPLTHSNCPSCRKYIWIYLFKSPLAARYISGNEITTAAKTVAPHEKATLTAKYSIKNLPIGLRIPKIYSKKNPATVGGSTSGRVNSPSNIVFIVLLFRRKTSWAAATPRKNVTIILSVAVLKDIIIGDKSIVIYTSLSFLLMIYYLLRVTYLL